MCLSKKEFDKAEGRIVEIENVVDQEITDKEARVTSLEEEIQTARGSAESIDARLNRALNENGTLKAGKQIHTHYRARYIAEGGESEVLLTQFTSKKHCLKPSK